MIIRLDAPIYFGNAQFLEDKVDEWLEQHKKEEKKGVEGKDTAAWCMPDTP